MNEKLTRGRLLRIWWAWQWRTVVATFVGSLVLITVFAFLAGFLGMEKSLITAIGNLIYMGVGIFASIYFLGFVLKKDFGDFRLTIEEKVYCDEEDFRKQHDQPDALQSEDQIV
ncbi:hypothetical protein [Hydrogenimonas urashimensis]|uniref:hypothetical protein n=1 Tax=Hydrogenimonas urashimensis TaxID=2740515 RepID=UPI0019155219|nr:hypothetical protein [Hydrogenimonas urashimensis]